jgi:hypothetical protein
MLTGVALAAAQAHKRRKLRSKRKPQRTKLTKPPKLANFKDWMSWWELWDTYMQQSYGTTYTPLSYIYREHRAVTAEIRNVAYAKEDDCYIATTELTGLHFQLDNKSLEQTENSCSGWARMGIYNIPGSNKAWGCNALLTVK